MPRMFKLLNRWGKTTNSAPVPELDTENGGVAAVPNSQEPAPSAALEALVSRKAFAEVATFYAQYLLESGKADSKQTCIDMVSKFVSAGMDRGDATANELESVKIYIERDDFKIRSPWEIRWSFMREIIEGTMDNLEYNTQSDGFAENELQLIKAFRDASETYNKLKDELRSVVVTAIDRMVEVILTEYASSLDPEFISRFSKK